VIGIFESKLLLVAFGVVWQDIEFICGSIVLKLGGSSFKNGTGRGIIWT